ncbi:hypothetical protein ACTFIY_007237 [Dictyostelium cf. discoideum]
MISQSSPDAYNFMKPYIAKRENSFKAIFIPNDSKVEPFEIYLSKDKYYDEVTEILNGKGLRKELISKNDVSYYFYPDCKVDDIKSVNERALKTKKKKALGGDAVLIRGSIDRVERDLTYEQFLRFEEFFSPKQRVFDFENNYDGTGSTDLLSVLFESSKWNYKIDKVQNGRYLKFPNNPVTTDWKFEKKQPQSILNEYKAVIQDTTISIESFSIGPNNSSPFFSTATINNGPLVIYSNLTKKKDESTHNVCHRVLYYLVILQQRLLGFSNHDNIENDKINFTFKNDYLIEFKEFEEFEISKNNNNNNNNNNDNNDNNDNNNNNNNDNNTTTTTTTTTTLTTVNATKNNTDSKKKSIIEKTENFIKNIKNDNDIITFYGIKMNRNNKVIYVTKGISNIIINENEKKKKVEFGDEVVVSFSYYLADGKLVKDQTELTITVGESQSCIDGLHHSLMEMHEGDLVLSIVHSKYAYGEKGIIFGDIDFCNTLVPPSSTLGILIELLEIKHRSKFTNTKVSSLSLIEKINLIKSNNQDAKEHFLRKDYFKALKIYRGNRVLCNLDLIGKIDSDDLWDEIRLLAAQTHTNLALCYQAMPSPHHQRIIEYCNESIVFEETSKAYRLSSEAYKELNNIEKAIEQMEIAKEIDFNIDDHFKSIPENKNKINPVSTLSQSQYIKKIDSLKRLERKELEEEKGVYKNILKNLESSGFDLAKDDHF